MKILESNYFTADSDMNVMQWYMRVCNTYIPLGVIMCIMLHVLLLSIEIQITQAGEQRWGSEDSCWDIIHMNAQYRRNNLIYLSFSPKE